MIATDLLARSLRILDPEKAHRLAIAGLAVSRSKPPLPTRDPRLSQAVLGLHLPNPIGLAAGFDKDGAVPDKLLGLGFGFVEVGTVTPLPQPGNPLPRLFRLPRDRALINRLGFNNQGHEALAERLDGRKSAGILGVNIGANRDSDDRAGDYVAGVRMFAPLADYLAINVSSPNTPGLRDLQGEDQLPALLARVAEARAAAAAESGRTTPVLVKIAPDMSGPQLAMIVESVLGAGLEGMIVSNTTTTRPELRNKRAARQHGGLSGRPLFERSTAMLARARQLAGNDLVLVGVGGVEDAATAWSKIAAGADLVQLYTSFVYRGPSIPAAICAGLLKRLDERHIGHITDLRGIETPRWASGWSDLD